MSRDFSASFDVRKVDKVVDSSWRNSALLPPVLTLAPFVFQIQKSWLHQNSIKMYSGSCIFSSNQRPRNLWGLWTLTFHIISLYLCRSCCCSGISDTLFLGLCKLRVPPPGAAVTATHMVSHLWARPSCPLQRWLVRLGSKRICSSDSSYHCSPLLDEAIPPVLDGLSSLPSLPPRVDTCYDNRPHFKHFGLL